MLYIDRNKCTMCGTCYMTYPKIFKKVKDMIEIKGDVKNESKIKKVCPFGAIGEYK